MPHHDYPPKRRICFLLPLAPHPLPSLPTPTNRQLLPGTACQREPRETELLQTQPPNVVLIPSRAASLDPASVSFLARTAVNPPPPPSGSTQVHTHPRPRVSPAVARSSSTYLAHLQPAAHRIKSVPGLQYIHQRTLGASSQKPPPSHQHRRPHDTVPDISDTDCQPSALPVLLTTSGYGQIVSWPFPFSFGGAGHVPGGTRPQLQGRAGHYAAPKQCDSIPTRRFLFNTAPHRTATASMGIDARHDAGIHHNSPLELDCPSPPLTQ